MGKEAAAERYEPGPEFEEVREEAMLDSSPTESKEYWLIQWIKDKDLDASGFHGKELSLKLHKDGNLGSLESSSGKSYDLVSFAYQQPDATVYLPSGSETKAVGKISRRVCLVRHREHEELKKPNFGNLAPRSKKTTVSPKEYPLRKMAEKSAAKLALASLPNPSSVPSKPYTYILQKLAEKEHYLHPRYRTTEMLDPPAFISTVEFQGEIFKGEPGSTRLEAQINAAKVTYQHFEKKREVSDSSHPVLGGSDMQNGMSMPSSGQEIQSAESGPSVPKANDSDAGSSKEALAKKYSSCQGEQMPEHKRKREDESNVGDPNVSGKTSEGPDAPGAQSNTAAAMLLNTPEEPPKKKVKIADQ